MVSILLGVIHKSTVNKKATQPVIQPDQQPNTLLGANSVCWLLMPSFASQEHRGCCQVNSTLGRIKSI